MAIEMSVVETLDTSASQSAGPWISIELCQVYAENGSGMSLVFKIRRTVADGP